MPDWPARRLPSPVTGVGCQCWKPTLVPSRSMKSGSCWVRCSWCWEEVEEVEAGGVAGGEISTPLLQRWLLLSG
jgi:hypothetical protein